MKVGYSLLLREFVEAPDVDFGDCEEYQIVCPVCREPVFKKRRGRAEGADDTHFLSHYKAGSGDEKDCELRTTGLIPENLRSWNSVARGQTLESFQAVLRNAISRTEGAVHEPGAFDKAISRLLAKPVFRKDFVAYARQGLEVLPQMPDPRMRIAESLASFPKFASASPFWQRRMAAYVLDGIGHLLAPGSSANMQYVAAAAYVHIGLTADNYRRNRRASEGLPRMYDPLAAVDVIEALVHGKPEATIMKVAVRAAKVDKARTQDEARLRMTMLVTAIKGELVGPMMAILATAYSDLTREPPPAPILDDRIKEMMTEFGRLLAAMRADRSA